RKRQAGFMQALPSLPPPAWRWFLLVPALFCVSCSGGGSSLFPVEGQVLYKNEPAFGAVVLVHPPTDDLKALKPSGVAKKDGKFTLMTGQEKGAPAGEYTVTITWPEEVPVKKKQAMSMEAGESRDRLNGAYAGRASSKLKVQIK